MASDRLFWGCTSQNRLVPRGDIIHTKNLKNGSYFENNTCYG